MEHIPPVNEKYSYDGLSPISLRTAAGIEPPEFSSRSKERKCQGRRVMIELGRGPFDCQTPRTREDCSHWSNKPARCTRSSLVNELNEICIIVTNGYEKLCDLCVVISDAADVTTSSVGVVLYKFPSDGSYTCPSKKAMGTSCFC